MMRHGQRMRLLRQLGAVTVALATVALLAPAHAHAQANEVEVVRDDGGFRLEVDGEPFLIYGMNWGYIPIGENYSYDFWSQDDAFIREVLDREMTMLQELGVNAIRQFSTVPTRWVEYIYERYGIFTIVNHLMGRYGFEVNGVWTPNIDYNNPRHREAILSSFRAKVEEYRDVPGVLLFLLGNENNYGLHWTSFEIEALPGEEYDARAVALYTMMGEAAQIVQDLDPNHPVAIANGDIQYLDLMIEHCQALDIVATNVYRGSSMGDLYQRVNDEFDRPVFFSEFGADAYDARRDQEDDVAQARYLHDQWREIYHNVAGQQGVGNALGGVVFQWTDGWWKYLQESNLDVHDTNASWPNGGYWRDYVEGENNMNEEWFGITAKDPPDADGHYTVRPRTAYWVLQEAWRLDPYSAATTAAAIDAHYDAISPAGLSGRYAASQANAELERLGAIRVSDLRLIFDSSVSAGQGGVARSSEAAFDHTESVYLDVELQPSSELYARVAFNVVGNVADNRLDNIFYEQRVVGEVTDGEGETVERVLDRIGLYQAEFEIKRPWFQLDGYYRVGHYHWGYEGDFFGLYPEAYYGENIDIYNGVAPIGMEFTGRRELEGFKLAGGPEIAWGANPTIIGKYHRTFGNLTLTLMHQEDIARRTEAATSNAIPEPLNRRSAVVLDWQLGRHRLEIGGLWSGQPRVGEEITYAEETDGRGYLDSGYEVLSDEVQPLDALGAKARLTLQGGRVQWYTQASYRGLVNDSGVSGATNVTGWTLRESGRGNHYAVSTGLAYINRSITIAPNALYQVPLIGPNPSIDSYYSDVTGVFYPALRPRNVLDDPFAVLDNRETIGGELLFVYDPTPGTWYFQWNRLMKEDAPFAFHLDLVYRHQPTRRDSAVFIQEGGGLVPFGVSPPARDEWEATMGWVANTGDLRLDGTLFSGQGLPNGGGQRLVTRGGTSVRAAWRTALLSTRVHINDWGPYDYHRDFNLTYPVQWYGDLSYGLRRAVFGEFDTRFGLRAQYRTLNRFSEGFTPNPDDLPAEELEPRTGGTGAEYEVGMYVRIGLGGPQ